MGRWTTDFPSSPPCSFWGDFEAETLAIAHRGHGYCVGQHTRLAPKLLLRHQVVSVIEANREKRGNEETNTEVSVSVTLGDRLASESK